VPGKEGWVVGEWVKEEMDEGVRLKDVDGDTEVVTED